MPVRRGARFKLWAAGLGDCTTDPTLVSSISLPYPDFSSFPPASPSAFQDFNTSDLHSLLISSGGRVHALDDPLIHSRRSTTLRRSSGSLPGVGQRRSNRPLPKGPRSRRSCLGAESKEIRHSFTWGHQAFRDVGLGNGVGVHALDDLLLLLHSRRSTATTTL
jgi:hypothetical protein